MMARKMLMRRTDLGSEVMLGFCWFEKIYRNLDKNPHIQNITYCNGTIWKNWRWDWMRLYKIVEGRGIIVKWDNMKEKS